jgi:hypothetical protein
MFGFASQPAGQLTALPHVALLAYSWSQQAAFAWVSFMPVMLMLAGFGEVLRPDPLSQGNADVEEPGSMFAQVAPALNASVQLPG